MLRPITTLAAAGALAAATVSVPTQANALAEWVIPAIVIAGVGGFRRWRRQQQLLCAACLRAGRLVHVQPRAAATCQIVRERAPNGTIRRVQICQ